MICISVTLKSRRFGSLRIRPCHAARFVPESRAGMCWLMKEFP